MATVFEGVLPKSSVLLCVFCGPKDSMKRNVSCLRCEVFVAQSGSQLGGKRFADDEEAETEMRMWLRQQSKDFYAAGFDALVKRWDEGINVDGYVEK
jgi:hypothetical protein